MKNALLAVGHGLMHCHTVGDAFDLKLVAPFVVLVDEHMRYRVAAQRLGIGQPALSRQMARLQHEVGATLLVRDGRNSLLTPAGERFAVHARAIVERVTALETALLADDAALRLHLGNAAHRRIGEIISAFGARHPSIAIESAEGTGPAAAEALRSRRADVAFGLRDGCPDGMSFGLLEQAPLGVLTSAGHPMAARSAIRWSELAAQSLVFGPDRNSNWNTLVRACLADSGVEVIEVIGSVAGGLRQAVPMITRGDAALVTGRSMFDPLPPGLAWTRLEPDRCAEFGIMWNPRLTGHAARRFVEFATSEVAPAPAVLGFDLRLLPSYVAVADTLHFGRAAERLMLAQPALSRQVAKLEAQLGTLLLARSHRKVELTHAGRTALAAGRDVLDLARRATSAARTDPVATGVLKVHYRYHRHPVLTGAIAEFRRQHPQAHVQITDGGTMQVQRAIADGRADLGITFGQCVTPEEPYLRFADVEYGVYCSADLGPPGSSSLRWEDLDGQRLFVPAPGYTDEYDAWLKDRLARSGSTATMLTVAVPLPDMILPALVAGEAMAVGGVDVFRPGNGLAWLPFEPREFIEYGVIWDTANDNPLLRSFTECIARASTASDVVGLP